MKIFDENIDSLSKRSSLLRLSAGVIAESLRNGNFKSAMKGQGIEFRDVREYFPQDNVRSIDWNVTARMGKAFVRQYEEDKELHVFFVFVMSVSFARCPRKQGGCSHYYTHDGAQGGHGQYC